MYPGLYFPPVYLAKAIYLLTTGAREAAFRNIKTVAECLADELVNAAKGSSNRCEPAFEYLVQVLKLGIFF